MKVPGILLSVVERVNPSGSVFQKGRRIAKQDRHRALNQDIPSEDPGKHLGKLIGCTLVGYWR